MKNNSVVKVVCFLMGFAIFPIFAACQTNEPIKAKRISRNNEYAITIPKNSKNTVRFEVREGEIASNGGRAELMDERSGFEQDYSFKFKIVKYNYETEKHFIIADWHHSTELHKIAARSGENLYSPLVVHLIGDKIVVANRAGRFSGKVGGLKINKSYKMNILRVPIKYKGWNSVNVKIKWSEKNTGEIYAKINGIEVRSSNIRTTYDMRYPNFFKLGIYRNLTYKSDAILEFKDMYVGRRMLQPDFKRKLTGEKNNDASIIEAVKKKHN